MQLRNCEYPTSWSDRNLEATRGVHQCGSSRSVSRETRSYNALERTVIYNTFSPEER